MPISIYCLFFSWLSLSWSPINKDAAAAALVITGISPDSAKAIALNEEIATLYTSMELAEKGLSKQAFEFACRGYRQLVEQRKINRPGYLTICDFSQSVRSKRLYLIDMANNMVVLTTYVAHGKNSGGEYATRFSNRPESRQSSLGFYTTANTYFGEHGLSLRLTGLERGYNDKALQRNIVVHGADYIGEGETGRSYGCPALPKNESAKIIHTIKEGTCLFIYHPSRNYLHGSKILND